MQFRKKNWMFCASSCVYKSSRQSNWQFIMQASAIVILVLGTSVNVLLAKPAIGQGAEDKKISFKGNKITINVLFDSIYSMTGVFIMRENSKPVFNEKIDVSVRDIKIGEFLSDVLKNKNLKWSSVNQYVLRIDEVSGPANPASTKGYTIPAFPEIPPVHVRGRVLNEKGEPVIATVMVQKSTRGTSTDENGYFEFNDVGENITLIISAANIETTIFKTNKKTVFTIYVKTASTALNQVVISKGFYTERQRLSTANVTRVDGKDIEKIPSTNPLVALQGRVPGLEIVAPSGAPGSAPQVRIRGQNSLNRTAGLPLYVIDGVIMQSHSLRTKSDAYTNPTGSAIFEHSGIDPLIAMNPANIESIDVLKDADATAIYGSLGANGVIIITTKRAKNNGKLSIDLNVTKGISKMTDRIPLLNTVQYLELRREAHANGGTNPGQYDFALTLWDPKRNVDWQDELLSGVARFDNVQFAFSGGRSNTSFRFSGGYSNRGTVVPGNFKTENYNGAFDLHHRSQDDRFSFGLTTSYGHVKNFQASHNSLLNAAFNLAPNAPELYDENGGINWGVMDIGGGVMFTTFSDNPIAALFNNSLNTARTFVANTRIGYRILPTLNFSTNLGFTNTVTDEVNKFPLAAIAPQFVGPGSTGRASFMSNKRDNVDLSSALNYSKRFGEYHSLDVDAGIQFLASVDNTKSINSEGYQSDMLLGSLASATRWRFETDETIQYKYLAFYGRVGYRYKEKYLINLTGRRDGSSRFGPGKQFGNFGAISAGWIFSDEPWLKNSNLLSFGKLRSSYGIVGSDNVGNYMFHKLWKPGNYTYHDYTTLLPFNLDNPDYRWEQTKKWELGLELGFFNDRLNFSGSYYIHRTGNQLVLYQLPSTTGFSSITQNLDAVVQNAGIELSLMSRNISTKHFSWTTSLNVTVQRNKLIAFPGLEESPYADMYKVGKSLTVQNWYTYEGIDPATGKFRFKDLNKDGEIDYEDLALEEDMQARFLGGISNAIRYKSFDVQIQLYFTSRNSYSPMYPYYPAAYSNNVYAGAVQRWQKPGDITSVPRLSTNSDDHEGFQKAVQSNYVLQNASYIRLSNLTLNYSLQGKALKATRLTALSVFVNATNLFVITGYKGMDPESGVIGLPQPKVFTGGFRLTI
jgi:TonB-linked SusC/RagA family outer membrane protein